MGNGVTGITVQLEEAEYLAAMRFVRRRSVKMWLFLMAGNLTYLGMGLFLLFFGTRYGISSDWAFFMFGMCFLMWILIAYGHFIALPKRVSKIFKQQKSLQRSYTIRWDDHALAIEGANESAKIPWPDFHKWRDSGSMFLLYSSDVMFRMLPKRAFTDPESAADFGQLLCEKIGPENVKKS